MLSTTKIITIIVLLSTQYRGDNNNVLGIAEAFKKVNASPDVTFSIEQVTVTKQEGSEHIIDANELAKVQDKIDSYINSSKKIIVLGAGIHGAESLDILQKNSNTIFAWSAHQIPASVTDLSKFNFTILPHSSLTEEQEKLFSSQSGAENYQTKLIETIGVPHTKNPEDIKAAYNNWIDTVKLPDNSGFLLVALGGDAPDNSGVQHYYTAQEAGLLGKAVARIAVEKNMVLLVTNGPRTGKYDHTQPGDKPIVANTHSKDSPIDLVSQAFLDSASDVLREAKKDASYLLFTDFKFGNPSLLDAFLGAVLVNNDSEKYSAAIMPGESTSQITEAIDILPPCHVFIFKNDAMSGVHESYLYLISKEKYAKIFSISEPDISPYDCDPAHQHLFDAEKVAKEISGEIEISPIE